MPGSTSSVDKILPKIIQKSGSRGILTDAPRAQFPNVHQFNLVTNGELDSLISRMVHGEISRPFNPAQSTVGITCTEGKNVQKIMFAAFAALFVAACGDTVINVPEQKPPNVTINPPKITVTATVVVSGCSMDPSMCGDRAQCVNNVCVLVEQPPPSVVDNCRYDLGFNQNGQVPPPSEPNFNGQLILFPVKFLGLCKEVRVRVSRVQLRISGDIDFVNPIGLATAFVDWGPHSRITDREIWPMEANQIWLEIDKVVTATISAVIFFDAVIHQSAATGQYVVSVGEIEAEIMGDTRMVRIEYGSVHRVVRIPSQQMAGQPTTPENGHLVVGLDASSPVARLSTAGTTGAELVVWNFRAIGATQRVERIRPSQLVTDTDLASFMNYARVYLEAEDGNVLESVVPTSDEPIFELNPPLIVPANLAQGMRISLKADLSRICMSCPTTRGGDHIGYELKDQRAVIVRSATSGQWTELLFAHPLPRGSVHILYLAAPVFTRLQTTLHLVNGLNDVARFRISGESGPIDVAKLTFDMAIHGVTVSEVRVVDVTDPMSELMVYSQTASTETLQTFSARLVGRNGGPITVDATVPHTFVIRAQVSGAGSGDSIVTRVYGDRAPAAIIGRTMVPGTVSEIEADGENDFIWSDRSASSHSTTTRDWTNGYLVSGLASTFSSPWVVSL